MTLEDIYLVTQIIAAIAVIGSLLYVGTQLKQNTTALQAGARTAALDGDLSLIALTVENPKLIALLSKPNMDDNEMTQLYMYLLSVLRLRERDWLQYRAGVLDERTWKTYEGSIIGTFCYTNSRKWWNYVAKSEFFDTEFKKRVSDLLEDVPASPELGTLAAFR
jgi:hypothetical protein